MIDCEGWRPPASTDEIATFLVCTDVYTLCITFFCFFFGGLELATCIAFCICLLHYCVCMRCSPSEVYVTIIVMVRFRSIPRRLR
jgi:hypothetical protein